MTFLILGFILCVDLPDLFLNIHSLHPLHLFPLIQLPVVVRGRLLSPRLLLFANDRLTRDAIKDVRALRGEALEVGSYIGCRKICGRCPEIRLLPLLLPARV